MGDLREREGRGIAMAIPGIANVVPRDVLKFISLETNN